MPTIVFGEGISGTPSLIGFQFANILTGTVVSESRTEAVIALGTTLYSVQGRNLAFDGAGEDRVLAGGTLDAMTVLFSFEFPVLFSDLGFDVGALAAAHTWDLANPGGTALDDLVYPLGWTYLGGPGNDNYTDPQVSRMSGDDLVNLRGGNDNFTIGDGNDTVYGAQGFDTIGGDAGNDVLRGGRDDDLVQGGAGSDRLFGDSGADRLDGGDGNDTLTGGTGRDELAGGGGADLFRFRAGDGTDRIFDFSSGLDRIEIETVAGYTLVATGAGLRVDYDGGSITLADLGPGDLAPGDIFLV